MGILYCTAQCCFTGREKPYTLNHALPQSQRTVQRARENHRNRHEKKNVGWGDDRQKTRQTRPIASATFNLRDRPGEIDLRAKDDQKNLVFPILCNLAPRNLYGIFFPPSFRVSLGGRKEEFGHGCKIVTGSSSSFTSILIRGQTHEGECIFLLYGGGGEPYQGSCPRGMILAKQKYSISIYSIGNTCSTSRNTSSFKHWK